MEALEDPTVQAMIALIGTGLQAQYEAVDVAALVALIREAGIDVDASDAIEDTTSLIADNELMPDAADSTDIDELAVLLLIMAELGIDEGIQQATDAGVAIDSRDAAVDAAETYADERVQQLYIEATGEEGVQPPIDDPRLPQTLDPESRRSMAGLTVGAMRDNADADVPGVVAEAIPDSTATRAEFIADNEAGRAFNDGLATVGVLAGAVRKRWERTSSDNPRQIHLDNVGQIVDINQSFGSGDGWPGELPRCKCGVTLLF